jgi:Tfp pilus assembly protein PilF
VELDAAFPLPRVLLGQLYREQAMTRVGIPYEGRTISTVHVGREERDRLLRDAQAQLDQAVRLDPASPAALTELALVHRARGDSDGARALLERALTQNSDYPPARSEHGALLVEAGDRERGTAELVAAIQSNPMDWRLHVTAAEAYRSLGREQAAAEAYRKGVELLWQSRRAPAREGPTK